MQVNLWIVAGLLALVSCGTMKVPVEDESYSFTMEDWPPEEEREFYKMKFISASAEVEDNHAMAQTIRHSYWIEGLPEEKDKKRRMAEVRDHMQKFEALKTEKPHALAALRKEWKRRQQVEKTGIQLEYVGVSVEHPTGFAIDTIKSPFIDHR